MALEGGVRCNECHRQVLFLIYNIVIALYSVNLLMCQLICKTVNVKVIVTTISLCPEANLHATAILPFLPLLLCPCLCPFSRIWIFPVRARSRRAQHSPAPGSTRRAHELRSRSRGILHSRYRSWIRHI